MDSQAEQASLSHEVTPAFVAGKFGITVATLETFLAGQPWSRLKYREILGAERDGIIRAVLERIDSSALRVVGGNDSTVWERGWGEILAEVKRKGFKASLLRPQYFEHHRIMRFDGRYIDAGNGEFVGVYDELLRTLAFARHLNNVSKVVEIGCGTGTSQLILSQLLPKAELVASDWAAPSQDIVSILANQLGRTIRPVRFNMLTLEGWDELGIDPETAVVTVHALEQLGDAFEPLLNKLLSAKPRFCLHLEPILEHYDGTILFDYLAIKYHERRNYLRGWLTALRRLAHEGRVEILDERRLGFGDRYHEAYSMIKWQPT